MPDDSSRCGRCGSVREDGRWVRRAAGRAAPEAAAAGWRRPPPPAATTPAAPGGTSTGGSRGCVLAAVAAGLALIAVLVGVAVVLTVRPPAPAPAPIPPWSDEYGATFEAACRDTGASADYCRCAHEEIERRIPEADMRRFQRLLAGGQSLDAGDQQTFREVEARCAD